MGKRVVVLAASDPKVQTFAQPAQAGEIGVVKRVFKPGSTGLRNRPSGGKRSALVPAFGRIHHDLGRPILGLTRRDDPLGMRAGICVVAQPELYGTKARTNMLRYGFLQRFAR